MLLMLSRPLQSVTYFLLFYFKVNLLDVLLGHAGVEQETCIDSDPGHGLLEQLRKRIFLPNPQVTSQGLHSPQTLQPAVKQNINHIT